MKVKVNGELISIFSGAKVRDVVRKYSSEKYEQIVAGKKKVVDKQGHQVLLSGEITAADQEFEIISKNQIS